MVLWAQVEQENQHCLIFFPDISKFALLPNLLSDTFLNRLSKLIHSTTAKVNRIIISIVREKKTLVLVLTNHCLRVSL